MIYELKQPAFDALIDRLFQAYFDDSYAFAPLGSPTSFTYRDAFSRELAQFRSRTDRRVGE